MVAANGNEGRFNWVWVVRSVHNEKNEQVPINVGDCLFVCVDADGKSHFQHKNKDGNKDENSKLWDAASAVLDEKGQLDGRMPGTLTFQLTVEDTDCGSRISAHHQRNPDQGGWEGDPTTGSTG
ncbi:MAG: hypothetical protein AAGF46_08315 [Pseudomonadota bacterium]